MFLWKSKTIPLKLPVKLPGMTIWLFPELSPLNSPFSGSMVNPVNLSSSWSSREVRVCSSDYLIDHDHLSDSYGYLSDSGSCPVDYGHLNDSNGYPVDQDHLSDSGSYPVDHGHLSDSDGYLSDSGSYPVDHDHLSDSGSYLDYPGNSFS